MICKNVLTINTRRNSAKLICVLTYCDAEITLIHVLRRNKSSTIKTVYNRQLIKYFILSENVLWTCYCYCITWCLWAWNGKLLRCLFPMFNRFFRDIYLNALIELNEALKDLDSNSYIPITANVIFHLCELWISRIFLWEILVQSSYHSYL